MAFLVFVGLLVVTGLLRVGEVLVSWRRQAARADAVVAEGPLFPAMALLHAALIVLPMAEVEALQRPFLPWLAGLSAALLVAATALRVWTLSTLGRAWNVRVVRPEEQQVVTSGPYRWIRHPNYLCVVLEIVALPLFHTAVLSAIALTLWNAAVLVVRIRNEEAVLSRIPAWRDAFSSRSRLIPYVF
ncbi:MAG: hypothetical protein KC621_19765 [Myxococcales bacterium]|nr:hypothetical protein [Myxococcales bacterium]